MTSIVKFQSLSGFDDEAPHCHLLQIDDFKFLLDCGWAEQHHEKIIDGLKRHGRQIDAILISHPDLLHCGMLPYLGKLGITCPVYMTMPTCKMGQMFLYDLVLARNAVEDFEMFTLDDVDAVFDRAIQLKHNQTEAVRGQDYGLQIVPVQAGHMIGGTSWKIVKDEEEQFVYCVDANHKRETHLNGIQLDAFDKPTLMITDCSTYGYQQERRATRTERLVRRIQNTTTKGGNVLITTDTAGRALEMALLLEGLWNDERFNLSRVNLVMISNVAPSMIEAAKGMIEWMSEKIISRFTHKRENVFDLTRLKLRMSIEEVARIPEPKVVLATPMDMDTGFSRELFTMMAGHPKNAIIMSSKSVKGSLCRKIIENEGMSSITLEMKQRVPLVGPELEEFEKQREQEKGRAPQEKHAKLIKRLQEESSDESDNENENVVAKKKIVKKKRIYDIMMPHHQQKKEGGFFKKARKEKFPMFPFNENRIKWDDYGEIINPDDYKTHELIPESDPSNDDLAGREQSVTFGRHNPNHKKKKRADTPEEEEKMPTKCIKSREQVSIRCNIEFIDFEGRVDGESQLQILSTIKPKELILIRTKEKYKDKLIKDIKSRVQGIKIHMPVHHELIDATKESFIYQLKLKDSLLSNLNFVRVGSKDIEVARIRGRVDYFGGRLELQEESDEPRKLEIDDIPTLQPVSNTYSSGHDTIFINDTKLTDLKSKLIEMGMQAEFIGGNLVCNEKVSIKKSANGVIQVEGALSEEYFIVRKEVYANYAIV
ncbi:Oidioi.mRNA.OKI2018_I69.PAR.g12898.t1.cds [Oikopleura dioica]|uniref:Cleavage and polyadenylation specificity factor subunit 2 n=1 Tax=Oikopleura dioica TaxID=34765 RepID=A0ABN7S6Q0_OIKDI|nr:Oidioi.mRNA.OKI2018_I69.PAR.g12898.t1.cds [Oikopleura dioica]